MYYYYVNKYMKPSDRIREIKSSKTYISNGQQYIDTSSLAYIESVMQYLDEKWEKTSCARGEHKPMPNKEGINCGRCGAQIGERTG